ncbi:hypothetical protein [Streptomyces sp. Mg1]|uniref:hypothetical protein n=1 Tax=Streptomyces sp. Mg1 TaxID=465541 RepID=UPI00017EA13E|nr:hypothetical protein [Streptomyces sp. Mg1]EDX25610.1 hypothetical protein SSAG_05449 [Streptomyces sp. Mg1]
MTSDSADMTADPCEPPFVPDRLPVFDVYFFFAWLNFLFFFFFFFFVFFLFVFDFFFFFLIFFFLLVN